MWLDKSAWISVIGWIRLPGLRTHPLFLPKTLVAWGWGWTGGTWVLRGSSDWMVVEMALSCEVWPGRGVVMLHSGQSSPGTPVLPCSTTGTGPGKKKQEEELKWQSLHSCPEYHRLDLECCDLFSPYSIDCIFVCPYIFLTTILAFKFSNQRLTTKYKIYHVFLPKTLTTGHLNYDWNVQCWLRSSILPLWNMEYEQPQFLPRSAPWQAAGCEVSSPSGKDRPLLRTSSSPARCWGWWRLQSCPPQHWGPHTPTHTLLYLLFTLHDFNI